MIAGEAMNGLIPNSRTEEETVGLTKGSNICIGSKIWLPKLFYDTIMREKECSAFITNSSYALWKPKILATRVVREQRNVDRKALSPLKKNAIINMYEDWLKQRKMPQHYISDKMSRKN